jgi:thiopeptide-type bacteriocin biosynthesis protein
MELAERLFHVDSEAVLALAGILAEDPRGDIRWRLALVGMDQLLTGLDFDLNTRRTLLREMCDSFAAEFLSDATVKHQLGDKFRPERKGLEALLDGIPPAEALLVRGLEVLRRRSIRLAPVMIGLKACAAAGRLSVPLRELAPSYLHMHANRLLRSAHRVQELVLYDYLTRLYESRAARAKEPR